MTRAAEAVPAPGVVLPWDTAFFGFRIGRVTARRLDAASLRPLFAWAAAERLRCAYFFGDPDCPETLARAHEGGFKFVDIRMDFALEGAGNGPAAGRLRPAVAADLPAIEALARTAHRDTRFSKDTGFPAARAAELYAEWIRRDFREHHILVPADAAAGAGYVTCQLEAATATGRIGLIAVASEARQRGLGRQLVAGALAHFQAAGCRRVRVTTQASNVPAQRLYQAQGFRTAETAAIFHRWF